MVIALPPEKLDAAHDKHPLKLKHKFQNNLYLSVKHNYYGDDFRRIHAFAARAKQAGISIVATNDVHYHVPERRRLHDVLSCIREHCPLPRARGQGHHRTARRGHAGRYGSMGGFIGACGHGPPGDGGPGIAVEAEPGIEPIADPLRIF